ncbi:amino acid adenylation domain-containing protein [Micromonospora sp. NPDC047187]|uniref:amino acid adenylation domain-containing protein n=1 Tax=Micromonospora sp. NPDC047187 TaxID=3155262 RepID=UPI0033DCB746
MIPADSTVPDAFRRVAAGSPDAVALIAEDRTMTYRELDELSDRLAAAIAPETALTGRTIGIELARGVDLVVAELGVLKAGAACLMLDPALPPHRRRTMGIDADIDVLVSDGRDPVVPHRRLISPRPPAASRQPPRFTAAPDDPAWVMFTSGSTGRPKGVVATHRSVTATIAALLARGCRPGERWLQCAPISWDAHALEVWSPLLTGGSCVLYPGRRIDPARLATLFTRSGVTAAYLSASLFNVVVDEMPDVFAGVHTVITGGEAASPAHLGRIMARHPHLRLYNGYGPVETMIFQTLHRVRPADAEAPDVPIGTPLPGKPVRLLDERLRPVPDGQIGDLYAGGAGVALSYLGRPRETADRFMPDPGGTGTRLYRTGDRAWRDPDGLLHFAGRLDNQLKIRGFRVEPEEVESVLSRSPAVDRVAVAADAESTRLVAYVVPDAADPAAVERQLRPYAARHLPEHLVPDTLVVVDDLPRTASGKLDRAALRRLVPAPAGGSAAEASRGPAESLVGRVFGDVLGTASVSRTDDFFALGGDSLRAVRVLSRINATTGAALDIAELFDNPTVAALARRLDGYQLREPASPTPTPAPADATVLSPAQRRLWLLDQAGAGPAYLVPIRIALRGPLDATVLTAAIRDVVARHEPLRTVFPAEDGSPRAVVRPAAEVDVPLHTAGPDAVRRAATRAFDLAREVPLRVTLSPGPAPDEHTLLLTMHHIAVDGWSLRPLLRDLGDAYAARLAGGPPQWPALPSHAEYHRAEADRLGAPDDPGSTSARQLAFWRRTLDGLRPRSAWPVGTGMRTELRHLDRTASAAVAATAARHGVTPFMVLHAALAVALRRAQTSTDVVVAAPVAGRHDPAADDLVGFFVNQVVLRCDLAGDPDIAELLRRVRAADVAAFAHQDIPFDLVVQRLNPPRVPGRMPFTDIALVLQHNSGTTLSLPGVEAAVRVVRPRAPRYGLLVEVTEEAGGLTVAVEQRDGTGPALDASIMADGLRTALTAITTGPATARISTLLADAAEPTEAPPSEPSPTVSTAPASRLVRLISNVWSELLDTPAVTPHDDFFRLGGSSLTAVRAAARLSRQGLPVSTAMIFSHPTVSALASALSRSTDRPLPPIPRAPRHRDIHAPTKEVDK